MWQLLIVWVSEKVKCLFKKIRSCEKLPQNGVFGHWINIYIFSIYSEPARSAEIVLSVDNITMSKDLIILKSSCDLWLIFSQEL